MPQRGEKPLHRGGPFGAATSRVGADVRPTARGFDARTGQWTFALRGGPPCIHWQEAIRTRPDLLYVVAGPVNGDSGVPCRSGGDTVLPAASPAALRRHFTHLLALKRRYTGDLPAVGARSFRWKGVQVPLTVVESEILRSLYAHEGEVVDRVSLAHLAGCSAGGDSRALDARIHRLREKLHRTPGVELVTERQRGWKLLLS